MSESSSPTEGEPEIPDLVFPVLEPVPVRERPDGAEAAARILELSEAMLPLVNSRPDFEARRLALQSRVPFVL